MCVGHLGLTGVTILASGVHRTRSTGLSGTSAGSVSGRNAQDPLLRESFEQRKVTALDELKNSLLHE
jgi:hypothetical protein